MTSRVDPTPIDISITQSSRATLPTSQESSQLQVASPQPKLLTFAAATFRGISTLLIDQVTYFLGNSAAGAISDIALADPNPRLVTGDKLLSLSMWSSRVAGATSGSIVLSLVQSSNNLGVSSPIVTLTSTQGVNFGLDTAPIVPNIAIDLVNNLYFLRLTLNLAAGRPNGDLGVTVVRLTVLPLSLDRR